MANDRSTHNEADVVYERQKAGLDYFGSLFAIHASREIHAPTYDRIAEIAPELATSVRNGDEVYWSFDVTQRWFKLSRITSAVIAVGVVDRAVWDTSGLLVEDIRRELGAHSRWWFADQVGYVLRDVVALREPVPCGGRLGFWTLPEDVETKVRSQL